MATHKVNMCLPALLLGNADVEFEVKRDGVVLGTLKVSKGAVEWRQKNQRKNVTHKLDWTEIDDLFVKHGK